jgi:replication factor A3
MAESVATPRINASYLEHFTNQTVRLTGKVVKLMGERATVDSSGSVTVHLNRVSIHFCYMMMDSSIDTDDVQDSHLTVGHAVEIVGKVNQDLSIKVLQATDMGTTLGMSKLLAMI